MKVLHTADWPIGQLFHEYQQIDVSHILREVFNLFNLQHLYNNCYKACFITHEQEMAEGVSMQIIRRKGKNSKSRVSTTAA